MHSVLSLISKRQANVKQECVTRAKQKSSYFYLLNNYTGIIIRKIYKLVQFHQNYRIKKYQFKFTVQTI